MNCQTHYPTYPSPPHPSQTCHSRRTPQPASPYTHIPLLSLRSLPSTLINALPAQASTLNLPRHPHAASSFSSHNARSRRRIPHSRAISAAVNALSPVITRTRSEAACSCCTVASVVLFSGQSSSSSPANVSCDSSSSRGSSRSYVSRSHHPHHRRRDRRRQVFPRQRQHALPASHEELRDGSVVRGNRRQTRLQHLRRPLHEHTGRYSRKKHHSPHRTRTLHLTHHRHAAIGALEGVVEHRRQRSLPHSPQRARRRGNAEGTQRPAAGPQRHQLHLAAGKLRGRGRRGLRRR